MAALASASGCHRFKTPHSLPGKDNTPVNDLRNQMSVILYPIFRIPLPDMNPRTSGEFLAKELEALDEIAEDFELTPMSAFMDQRQIPEDFDGPPWEMDEVTGPCDDWYSATEGKAAFEALARIIREKPKAMESLQSPKGVVEELEDLAASLAIAENLSAEFRLGLS
jgi:hypothetical protein